MTNIIQVENLIKHYKDTIAVNGISFNVAKGQCFGLLGPNGAGKTTTIEIMENIISATSGEVKYNLDSKNISGQIGIQFQQTSLQDFLTVTETLKLFSSFYENSVAIDQLIEDCDLGEFVNKDNRLLSGGQRQRLLLALALVNDPAIVFLDEPTTGLDPQARRQFWRLIQRIKATGKTIILTTHYMDEAEQLCDEIVIMNKGDIVERGSPRALLKKHFTAVFIYLPSDKVPAELLNTIGGIEVDNHIEITSTNVEQTIRNLIQLGISLDGLHVKSANLDDLFLKLTGHSLKD